MKVIKYVFVLVSLSCFVLSLITGNLVLEIIGSIFLLLLLITVHELGHVVGCLITKTKVVSITILGITFSKTISFKNNISCNIMFVENEKKRIVYLMGILFTLLSFVFMLFLFQYFQISCTFFITSILFTLFNFIPLKNSDVVKVLERK